MSSNKAAALLVGINYIMDSQNRLNGCCNDVTNMANLLINKFAFPRNQVVVIADTNVKNVPFTTRESILRRLYELAIKTWKDDLETVYFHYSGHGSQQRDFNGDESDGLDEGICPSDFATSGLIIDDDLISIFKQFNPKTKIVAVFDCCHSGTILDLPFIYNSDGTPNLAPTQQTPQSPVAIPNIIMLSGCIDSDTSADAYDPMTRQAAGALTMSLIKAINDPNPNNNLLGLYERIVQYIKTGRYTQRPVLSSSRAITPETRFA